MTHDTGTRVLIGTLREELRAPVAAIREYAGMLAEDGAALDFEVRADISKIKQAGARLAQVVDGILDPGAKEAADLTGADIRHELRTPLNHVIGYSEMLREDAEDLGAEPLVPDLDRIVRAGKQLLDRIEDLLTVGSAEKTVTGTILKDLTTAHLVADVRAQLAPDGVRARSTEPGRVLVVDDNEANRELLVRRLERQGHQVLEAADGRAGLEAARQNPLDLILLDMVMPELNGYEVLTELKADRALANVPVIMITAFGEVEAVVRCIELGAEDYLAKPFNPVVLDARIGACLEAKRLRDREVEYRARIEEERRRSDRLLSVILPDEVVQELKASGRVAPRRFEDVAVLFTDVVGFTAYSDAHPAEEVVSELQRLVDRFEVIAERRGLEKIKTVGDAFMATAGLLKPVSDPVMAAVRAGLEMAAYRGSADWKVRVGIHVGPVMAGVVGRKKYLFDLWGDTVNLASRVESNGVPGALCVTREIWERVEDRCEGHSRGAVAMKGKGELEVFQVEGLLGR